jgi:hypothetical protein
VRKTYQDEEIDTSQPTVPEAVSVALAALAGEVQGGFVGPGGGHRVTSRADNGPNATRVEIWDGQGGLTSQQWASLYSRQVFLDLFDGSR